MSKLLKLPTGDKNFYRYMVEHLAEYVKEFDDIAFGRYNNVTDPALIALANEGLLKGKNLYFSSKRTKIPVKALSKVYGAKVKELESLKDVNDSEILYARDAAEIDAILDTYDEETLSKKVIVCDNRETVNYALYMKGMENAVKWDEIGEYKKFLLVESSDQTDENGNMLIGNDMRGGLFRDYSLKDVKDIMYNAYMLVNVSKSDRVQRIGDDGKKIIVEYEPGYKEQVIDFLVDRLALLDDSLKGKIETKRSRYPAGSESVTTELKNVMKLPYDMAAVYERWMETPEMTETQLERYRYIGPHSTGLATHKKPNMEILRPRMGEKPKIRAIPCAKSDF